MYGPQTTKTEVASHVSIVASFKSPWLKEVASRSCNPRKVQSAKQCIMPSTTLCSEGRSEPCAFLIKIMSDGEDTTHTLPGFYTDEVIDFHESLGRRDTIL